LSEDEKNTAGGKPATPIKAVEDQDVQKGAVEDDQPSPGQSNHPGLDSNGLPNDPTAIAQDAIGAKNDESQG
jgi:hypothetical protein